MCSVNPTVPAPDETEYKPSDLPLRLPMSKPKPLPKKLELFDIPTFVPQNALGSEELVWSPTSGTRPRRRNEIYQQSTKGRPATPLQFGPSISPNVTSAYSIKSQYLFHGSRDFSDSLTKGLSDSIRMSPPPQFKSIQSPLNPSAARAPRSDENTNQRHRRYNNSGETSFPGSIDRMMEMTTLSPDDNSRHGPPSHFDSTAYPINDLSRTNSPSHFRGPRYPSSHARGVYGAEPFSAPPSVPGYGNLHQTGQGMYGGPPSPFQGKLGNFQPGPVAAPLHGFAGQVPHVPNPENWTTHPPRPQYEAFQNQLPDQIIQPIPQRVTQAQIPPFINQAPFVNQAPLNNDALVVPPPGSMPPLDYWNMLHQRETEIRTRLQNANRPVTTQEHQYIALLGEARVNAAATQIPARGNSSKGKWVAELNRTLQSIWKTGPAGMRFSPVVVARKLDFEKAVEREIALVSGSQGRRFGGEMDRGYGA